MNQTNELLNLLRIFEIESKIKLIMNNIMEVNIDEAEINIKIRE